MTFLTSRQRAAAIERMFAQVGVAALGGEGSEFVAEDHSRALAFVLSTSRTDAPADAPLFETDAFGIQLRLLPFVEGRETVLVVSAHMVAMLDCPAVRHPIASDREFSVRVERVVFDVARKEPRTSLFGRSKNAPLTAGRLGKVERAERPPELEEQNLKDRLRWILTPPINELLSDPDLALPARPFGFQLEGIKWFYDHDGALLADEMGLGKTMQAIIAARLLWRDNKVKQILVICPKSLISNWQSEFKMWWPNVVSNLSVYEPAKDRQWFLKLATANVTVKLMNY